MLVLLDELIEQLGVLALEALGDDEIVGLGLYGEGGGCRRRTGREASHGHKDGPRRKKTRGNG